MPSHNIRIQVESQNSMVFQNDDNLLSDEQSEEPDIQDML